MRNIKWEYLIGLSAALLVFLAVIGVNVGPLILLVALIGVLYFNLNGKTMAKGTNTSLKNTNNKIKLVSFDEIGGQDFAKRELQEAIEFMMNREQIKALGIRPMKGILLTGPPGTGKTLLAKAAAHETGSVFIGASGSEFVEMYIGTGASRIRELFQKARKQAEKEKKKSAIIFIDEIDVFAGKRDGGQHKEYDQTLNQLLTELDGIYSEGEVQILFMAATNRKDMLDDALLRPGRLDRQIEVSLPDKKGRQHILELHARNKPLADDVDLTQIAKDTFQFSGAQLEAVMNEGAIYAMREKSVNITMKHLQDAIDKVLLGERNDREASKEDKVRVARHELGHAIMAEQMVPNSVAQVVLSPRGGALGFVRHTPTGDKYLYTKSYLEGQIMIALGGAVAEEIYYGERSTGSKGDFNQAISIIHTMVESGLTNLGVVNSNMMTPDRWASITNEILDDLFARTKQILTESENIFEQCLSILMDKESIDGNEFRNIVKKLPNAS